MFSSQTVSRRYDEMTDQSLAQSLANNSKTVVNAYLKRSEYSDTFNTSEELDFLDACESYQKKIKPERPNNKKQGCTYQRIMNDGPNEIDRKKLEELQKIKNQRYLSDGYTFDPNGALHPVRDGDMPKGVVSGLQTFKFKSK